MKNKNLISKSDKQNLTKIAKEMARFIGKIDALQQESRELVGFEHVEGVYFFDETDFVWTDDKRELAKCLIDWCKNARSKNE